MLASYLFLRRGVGLLGMALPPVLVFGELATSGRVLYSMSGYYYSDMRNICVGALCAVGVFLLCYRGYERVDTVVSVAAGLGSIGTALFPTKPPDADTAQRVVGDLHLMCAGLTFSAMAVFCLFLFPRTGAGPVTPRKRSRNRIYRTCGAMIVGCLIAIVVVDLGFESVTAQWRPVLWLESIATLSFGFAWLVKGDTLLRDVRQ